MSTVSVVATVELDNTPPRVRLDVTDTGSSPEITSTTVTRLDPDGRTVEVRTFDGNPLTLVTSGSDRVGLLYDYEMPYGTGVSYSTVESPDETSAEVTVDETNVWLIHPGVPEVSTTITVAKFGNRSHRVQRGVFYPMGRSTPVVQTDGVRKAAEYELSVLTRTDDERLALESILSDTAPLLLNVPFGKAFGISHEYVSIGDDAETRLSPFAGEALRVWELPCTVVDRPSGGSQAERTLVDLLVYPTLDSLMAQYDTLNELLAGP